MKKSGIFINLVMRLWTNARECVKKMECFLGKITQNSNKKTIPKT